MFPQIYFNRSHHAVELQRTFKLQLFEVLQSQEGGVQIGDKLWTVLHMFCIYTWNFPFSTFSCVLWNQDIIAASKNAFYVTMMKDRMRLAKSEENVQWLMIFFPKLNGEVVQHCSTILGSFWKNTPNLGRLVLKRPLFRVFSQTSFRDKLPKIPPFPRKKEDAWAPLNIRGGGGRGHRPRNCHEIATSHSISRKSLSVGHMGAGGGGGYSKV